MNVKTPVSALQELMAARKLPLPVYVEEGTGTAFKCTVHAAGVSAVGTACNKKMAKHESAKNALEKMGRLPKSPEVIILQKSSPLIEKPQKNYVGELNEFCSKNSFNYPDYDFVNVTLTGEFLIKCKLMGKEMLGHGVNKKDAKQNSAAGMLKLVGSMDPHEIASSQYKVKMEKIKIEDFDREEIMSLYKQLTINDERKYTSKTDYLQANPNIKIDEQDSVDDLQKKLQSYRINYTVTKVQSKPCIISFMINDTALYFVGSGNTPEEATRNGLQQMLAAAKCGVSLSTNDLISFK